MPAARGPSPLAASLEGLGPRRALRRRDAVIFLPQDSLWGHHGVGCWEAGEPLETDVAIARRERGGHDGVLRERGSAMELYKPTEPEQDSSRNKASQAPSFGKELGQATRPVGTPVATRLVSVTSDDWTRAGPCRNDRRECRRHKRRLRGSPSGQEKGETGKAQGVVRYRGVASPGFLSAIDTLLARAETDWQSVESHSPSQPPI